MAARSFYLYNATNATREAVLYTISRATETEELLGVHTLSLELNAYNSHGDRIIGSYPEDAALDMPILRIEKYIRVYDPASGDHRSFIIRKISKRHTGDQFSFLLHCENKKYELLNQIVRVDKEYAQITSDEYLAIVFADVTGFTVTTNEIPSTERRNVKIEQPTVLGALNYLHAEYETTAGRFYPVVAENGNIEILREDHIGSTVQYPLTFAHSVFKVTQHQEPLVNRLFCSGNGNGLRFAENTKYFKNTAGSYLYTGNSETYTLDNLGADSDPVALDSYIPIHMTFGGTWHGAPVGSFQIEVKFELLNSASAVIASRTILCDDIAAPVASRSEYVDLNVGTFDNIKKVKITMVALHLTGGGSIVNAYCRMNSTAYELSPNRTYVEDTTSQSDFGKVVEARLRITEHPRVINLIRPYTLEGYPPYSYLDSVLTNGTYSGGLHQLFSTVGVCSVSENTDSAYVLHGSKSQKLVTTGSGAGVHFIGAMYNHKLVGGVSHQFICNLYIVSGQIRISVYDNYPAPMFGNVIFWIVTQGVGWVQIISESPFGVDDTTPFDVVIIAESEGAEWYVDSLQIARSPDTVPFYRENSADILLTEATQVLKRNKDPLTTYEVSIVDLVQVDVDYQDYAYSVGDNILLLDDKAMLSEQLKIYRRVSNLLDPTDTVLTLAARDISMASIINLLAAENNLRRA